MRYLHTMVRVKNLKESMRFYCEGLGLKEVNHIHNEKARFSLIFLAAPEDFENSIPKDGKRGAPHVELTYNWPDEDGNVEEYKGGRNFGHLAYEVDDIYATCEHLMNMGIIINRPPRDGNMAFIRSPDNISIELLQKGKAKEPKEPWASMQNSGEW